MQQEKESEGKHRKNNNRAEGQLTEAAAEAAATSADLAMPYTAHCCDSTADSIDKDLNGGMKLKQWCVSFILN